MPRCDIEDISRAHLGDGAAVHRGSRAARDDEADMLDLAARRARRLANMQRPFPAWFIGRAPNRHAAYPNNLELALLKGAHFVRLLEPLQHHINVLNHHQPSALVNDRASATNVAGRQMRLHRPLPTRGLLADVEVVDRYEA